MIERKVEEEGRERYKGMEGKGYVVLSNELGILGNMDMGDGMKAFDILGFILGMERKGYSVEFVPIGDEEDYVLVKVQIKYFDKVSGKMYVKGFMLSRETALSGEFVPTLLRMLEMGERSVIRKLEQVREEEREDVIAQEGT